MESDTPGLRDLTRRIIENEPQGRDGASAAHSACERFYLHLARWIGPQGCHALFHRARAITSSAQPVLSFIQVRADGEPHLVGLEEALQSSGGDATGAALEAMLATVLQQLGQFIGEDLVATMVSRALSDPPRPRGSGPQSGGSS